MANGRMSPWKFLALLGDKLLGVCYGNRGVCCNLRRNPHEAAPADLLETSHGNFIRDEYGILMNAAATNAPTYINRPKRETSSGGEENVDSEPH
jgi:hypothetical protein